MTKNDKDMTKNDTGVTSDNDKNDVRIKSRGSEDIADMVLDAADEIEAELEDIYRDILAQGAK